MLYQLNSANLDCFAYYHPDFHVYESGPVRFSMELDRLDKRPYRTEVQLYKSLLALKHGIDRDLIITAQREALQTLRCILSNIEYRFYKAYGMEIEDKRTVYGECLYRLIPSDCEGKAVVAVNIQRGTNRPYYLAKKGLRPEGVYVRQGYSSVPATDTAIRQMIKETDGDSFEDMRSINQALTFETTKKEFKKRNVCFRAAANADPETCFRRRRLYKSGAAPV